MEQASLSRNIRDWLKPMDQALFDMAAEVLTREIPVDDGVVQRAAAIHAKYKDLARQRFIAAGGVL